MTTHNDTTCTKYNEPVLPDEQGNCSLCGAMLEPVKTYNQHEFSIISLERGDIFDNSACTDYGLTEADLDDDTMQWIARKLSDICMGEFWDGLEMLVQRIADQKRTERLEYLRGEIRAERISQSEIAELQSLAEYIEPGDVELLQWAMTEEESEKIEYKYEQEGTQPIIEEA